MISSPNTLSLSGLSGNPCSEIILVKLPDLVGILKNLLDLFLIKPFVKDLSESVVRIQKYLSGEKLYS